MVTDWAWLVLGNDIVEVEPRLVGAFAELLTGQLARLRCDELARPPGGGLDSGGEAGVPAVALLTYYKVSGCGHARERINRPWNFIRKMSWPHHCCKG
jgi:hypothetical protein